MTIVLQFGSVGDVLPYFCCNTLTAAKMAPFDFTIEIENINQLSFADILGEGYQAHHVTWLCRNG